MKIIKQATLVAGFGAALALTFAAPAAAHEAAPQDGKRHDKHGKDVNALVVQGEDQYCNAQGFLVVIKNSCNGNGGGSNNGNVGDNRNGTDNGNDNGNIHDNGNGNHVKKH